MRFPANINPGTHNNTKESKLEYIFCGITDKGIPSRSKYVTEDIPNEKAMGIPINIATRKTNKSTILIDPILLLYFFFVF